MQLDALRRAEHAEERQLSHCLGDDVDGALLQALCVELVLQLFVAGIFLRQFWAPILDISRRMGQR